MSERQYPAWVSTYIGLPFNKEGWTKEEGFHCWSLIHHILLHEFHIYIPTYKENFTDAFDQRSIEEAIFEEAEKHWQEVSSPQFGDLLLFRVGKHVSHIGFCLDDTFMLHIQEGSDASLARYKAPQWLPRWSGSYRYVKNATNTK